MTSTKSAFGSRWKSWLSATVAAAATIGAMPAARAQPAPGAIPVEAFFSRPKLQSADLSPSGRYLAALTAPPGRRMGFLIFDLESAAAPNFIEVSPKDDVAWFEWVSDEWLVFGARSPEDRSLHRDSGGLLAVKRDGSSLRVLINRIWEPEDAFQRKRQLNPDYFFAALGAPGSTEVIVEQASWDVRGEFSHTTPRVLNIVTSGLRTLDNEAPRASSWAFDAKGRARVAFQTKEGTATAWWADTKGQWRELYKVSSFDAPFSPQFVEGEDGLVVGTYKAGGFQLRRFDFATGKPADEVLVETPGFGSGAEALQDRLSGRLLGVGVWSDSFNAVWFSPAMKALQAAVDAKFPDSVNVIACVACDDPKTVLVHTYSDRDPGRFVLWKPKEGKWLLLGEAHPDVPPARMAPLEFHRAKARDGGDLPVWVTRPLAQHAPAAKPGPAVVVVHGGPFLRGYYWKWDEEAQFLASRGYVVIQPEFRGSTGYGNKHFRAGWKEWGYKMQDDVADAVRFAVQQGWVDPARVCIMGASYGGYSTLIGLVRDPDLYRCGVAHAAVTDPRYIWEFHWSDASDEWKRYGMTRLVGDREKDAERLKGASAVEQVEKINAPLLLSHGARDFRVPIEHAEKFLEAMRKAGKPVEWVRYPEEGHWFFYDQNRYDYYRRVEAFLAKHLKP